MTPRVSIITVLFKCDPFVERFFANITGQTYFDKCELICFLPSNASAEALGVLVDYQARFGDQIKVVTVTQDPGLYALWKQGIEMAQGEYISNANPDDLRSPHHVAKCVEALDALPDFDVCATQFAYTYDAKASWQEGLKPAEWIAGVAGEFRAQDLFMVDDSGQAISSRNIPHCMPVWRKSLHARFGYFDEQAFGPSADWEFWLRVLNRGARGWLVGEVLGLNYLSQDSYWHVNHDAGAFDGRIRDQYGQLAKPLALSRMFAKANQAYRRGDYAAACRLYRAYSEQSPGFSPAWTNQLLCLTRLDRKDEFRRTLQQFQQHFPPDSGVAKSLRQALPANWRVLAGEEEEAR